MFSIQSVLEHSANLEVHLCALEESKDFWCANEDSLGQHICCSGTQRRCQKAAAPAPAALVAAAAALVAVLGERAEAEMVEVVTVEVE